MSSLISKLGRIPARGRMHSLCNITYVKYQHYTMLTKRTYLANLRIVHGVQHVPGCVVECGTWKGGMIAGIADVLGPGRTYVLFDSFNGLPPAEEIDGEAALAWQANTNAPHYHNNCTAAVEDAQRAMSMSRAKDYRLVKGWFEQTMAGYEPPEQIAVLRLDADWFESTITCLTQLSKFLAPDGVIVIDDYYTWDGCSRAVHQFLSDTKSTARIRQESGVCVLRGAQQGTHRSPQPH